MRKLLTIAASVCLLAMPAGRAVAQSEPPRAVVEKAIKVHGGPEKLAKLNAQQMRSKGTVKLMGQEVAFTGESAVQMPARLRNELTLDIAGQKTNVVQVYNDGRGWVRVTGQTTMELQGPLLDELKELMYAARVESLVPLLKEKDFTLAPLGEVKVLGRPATGVRVSSPGHKDISLYFAREDGLLIKAERPTLDPEQSAVKEERYYSDFKEIEGVRQPMKVLVIHDGKRFMQGEVTEVKYVEKLDDSTFAKP